LLNNHYRSVYRETFTFRNGTEFRYLEEFPLALLPRFESAAGYPIGEHIAVVLDYGSGYSGPGNDVFRENRATGFPHQAHKSNFLHPVLYYYEKPFTGMYKDTVSKKCDITVYLYSKVM
jgi:hypothetical protein